MDKISTATWSYRDKAFMFGGRSYGILNSNDLWEYNMTTGLWTWHGGSTSPGSYYSYGIKGIANANNWPPNMYGSTSGWVVGSKLFYVGGAELSSNNYLSELWEYDINTGLWTWLNGETKASFNHPGVYSSKPCLDSPGLFPSSRNHANSVNTRVCNNSLWYNSGLRGNLLTFLNDLWLYKPLDNRWIWVYGKLGDTTYHYGQKGVSSPANKPPARQLALMWSDNQDRLYLFGGNYYNVVDYTDPNNPYNFTYGNDLWRYDPDYSCINYSLSEKFIDRNIKYKICVGDSTIVKVRAGYDSLRVVPMSAEVAIRTVASGSEISLKPSATKSYKIIAYGYRCESLLDSLTVPIEVYPPRISSETKTICFGGSYLGKTTTGSYVFRYPDPLKCDSIHTLTLTVRPQNIKTIDSTVCEGVSVYGRSVSGSYRDTFTGSNGCDSIRQLNLTVIPKNQLIDTAICRGQSLAGYTAAGTYYDTLTSTQGCVTYRVIKLAIKEPSSSSYSQTICEGQSYWGHSTTGIHTDILSAANGCDSTRTLNLTVNTKSFFTLTKEICRGDSYEGESQAGTYLDTFLNAKGCDSIRTLVLTLRNAKPIKKLKDTAICKGSYAVFDAGIGHINYLWTTGAQTPSIQVSQLGEYKLSYTDTANCLGLDSAKLSFYNDTEIILEDELSNYKGELLILNPKIKPSDVGGKYRWSPSQIFSCDSCRTVRFKLDSSAVVKLEFTDAKGCKAYKDVKVNIYDSWAVGFPTAFSPNGDSLNDTYFPNVANILSYTYAVYNRWGEKVYQATNMQPAWNGTYKGHPVQTGMYSYYAEVVLLNGVKQTYSGSFQVVR
ncbi:MAG: gliding motility-associated C-terminal domain-containing protein [Chitinophagales bacterium]|jgi:gliding motility-associated-like protein|nr:gliding motility-associated C-terminal domain-containing protein [Sphingobacteriales bacterium]